MSTGGSPVSHTLDGGYKFAIDGDGDGAEASAGTTTWETEGATVFAGQGTMAVPPGKPPLLYFYSGVGLSLGGVVVAVLLQQSWFGLVAGWLLAGPGAILALGKYVERDSSQRTRPMYKGGGVTRHYPMALGVLALVCVVAVAVLAAGKAARAW